jgi:hypothetical protein
MSRQLRICTVTFVGLIAVARFAVATQAHAVQWTEARTIGPFEIQANFPLAKYDALFKELPDLQREITRTLGVRPATSPIHVYIFSNEDDYRAYAQRHFPKVPYRSALFVLQNGLPEVYTYDKQDLDIDLRHECTHALLHSSLAAVPLWLDEGIAKYFEVPARERAFDHPYFDDPKWKWSVRLGMVRSMDSLEQRDNLSDLDATDYRYAWAWVHFMMHGPEAGHQALVHNIACYQQSTAPSKLSVELAAAVPNADEKMIEHFKHWQR